ncbi:hypothetical protein B0H13DRAFT_1868033 [Mycena leptocephala]|nr:hypothetical protein B0H13DRAFT_1868033 [Mycena leptocephala]
MLERRNGGPKTLPIIPIHPSVARADSSIPESWATPNAACAERRNPDLWTALFQQESIPSCSSTHFVLDRDKKNSSHNQAFCLGCIRHFRQVHGFQDPPNETDVTLLARMKNDNAVFTQATQHVRGVKKSMLGHLIGRDACPHVSAETKRKARDLKNGTAPAAESDTDDESNPQSASKKRKAVFRNVEKA